MLTYLLLKLNDAVFGPFLDVPEIFSQSAVVLFSVSMCIRNL